MGTFLSDIMLQVLSFGGKMNAVISGSVRQKELPLPKQRGVPALADPQPLPKTSIIYINNGRTAKSQAQLLQRLCGMPLSTFRYRAEIYEKAKLL